MDATSLIALLIVAALTALGVSVLLWNSMYRKFLDDREKRDDKIEAIQNTLDTSLVRLMRLEDKVGHTTEAQETEKKEDAQAAGQPVTRQSVMTALRHLGFSPEVSDKDSPDLVYFKIDDTSYRIDTSRLPFLTLELGFGIDPAEEDIESMSRAAVEVTAGIFIGKVNVLGEGKAVVFTAEWICDSYVQLRDTLSRYIDVVNESHRHFAEAYNKQKNEKSRKEAELASKVFPANDGATPGPKILS